MADVRIATELIAPFQIMVPVWFYLLSGLAYLASSLISFSVSYFALRLYRKSNSKKFLLIGLAFLLLGVAYVSLTLSSIYTYLYVPMFKETVSIPLSLFNSTAFELYYSVSLLSYLLLLITYFPMNQSRRLHLLYVPLWFTSSEGFHMASLFLITFIVLRSLHNVYKSRTLNSFLVLLSFVMIGIFHILTILLPFDLTLYLLSHVILASGFVSLLVMLVRVNRGGRV